MTTTTGTAGPGDDRTPAVGPGGRGPTRPNELRPIHAAGRGDIDPRAGTDPADESAAPAESGAQLAANHPEIQSAIESLINRVSGGAGSRGDQRLVREAITAALKLIPDGRDTGEIKLIAAALKELRYAYRVFGQYPDPHKVTIFGSARTPKDHPDYTAAVEFGRLMAGAGWMVITGAGGGIMEAGHEGPGRAASFGVAIRLPFEQETNEIIRGDQKLINFRYFFTRKLMFLSQAEAVVCFPGGFGTLDEAFETLTLIQTGKAAMVPVVFVEGADAGRPDSYWRGLMSFIDGQLLERGFISEDDRNLYHLAADPAEAVRIVLGFYRNYHSARYIGDELIIRTRRRLTAASIAVLNEEFSGLVSEGQIGPREEHLIESDDRAARGLPRLGFTHNRRHFGMVRRLIDRVNELETQ